MNTVVLHGESLPLTIVQRMVNDSNYTQRELADLIGCNQSMVSRYLRGATSMSQEAINGLESIFSHSDIQAEMSNYSRLEQFPFEDMYELMCDVHKQTESNDINVVMGLRSLINIGESWYVLGQEFADAPADTRLGAAFSLALSGRTYGNERNYLNETFYARFGVQVPNPASLVDVNTCIQNDGSVRHPCEILVDALLSQGMHVWGWGPTGCGKSEAGYSIANRWGQNIYRVQGKREFIIEEAFGKDKIKVKEGAPYSETLWGPVMRAAEEGTILMIDEISAIPPGYLFDFHNVLDRKPIHWDERTQMPGEKFCVYATDNTTGQAEDELYIGTTSMNEALRDRFVFVEYGFMSKEVMEAAVTNALKTRGVSLEPATKAEIATHKMQKAVDSTVKMLDLSSLIIEA